MTKTLPELNIDRLSLALTMKRGRRGLRAVAREVGVSYPTLSRVERGLSPDVKTFIRICAWLGMPMQRFVK